SLVSRLIVRFRGVASSGSGRLQPMSRGSDGLARVIQPSLSVKAFVAERADWRPRLDLKVGSCDRVSKKFVKAASRWRKDGWSATELTSERKAFSGSFFPSVSWAAVR